MSSTPLHPTIDRMPVPGARRSLVIVATTVAALLLIGWGLFAAVVLPGRFVLGTEGVFGIGLAATAFLLGVRHAFDPDHVAAIDNTTRKLVADGRNSVSVGFWFALGHSTVVVATVVLLTLGIGAVASQITSESSPLYAATAVWGPAVAGLFLMLIGALNIAPLRALLAARGAHRGEPGDGAAVESALQHRGLLARVLAPVSRRVDRPWKMYPVGLLFGLGFDTASTIALLILGANAGATAPWYVMLVVPLLFTAGMVTFDAANGLAMTGAYRWARRRPERRIDYNIIVTGLSVVLAFAIGLLSLSAALSEVVPGDGLLRIIGGVDLGDLGFAIVGLFIALWAIAWVVGRRAGRASAGSSSVGAGRISP